MAEMWKSLGIEVYKHWIARVIAELDLNPWEVEFTTSIYKRLHKNIDLTELQAKKLESIYVRTS